MKKFVMYAGLISFTFFANNFAVDTKNEATDAAKTSVNKPGPILLVHPLIHFIDKLMSSGTFGLLLQIRREVGKRLFGEQTKSGSKRGLYKYKGDTYSLVELARIEDKVDKEYTNTKNDLIANKANYDPAQWDTMMQDLENTYNQETKIFREVLAVIKDDFIEISKEYAESARGTKDQMLVLIKESCDKRGLVNSIMLKWGEEDEGNEAYYLKRDVITLKAFAKFLYDLRNFLTDMANSMPRCKKKFLSLVRKSQQST